MTADLDRQALLAFAQNLTQHPEDAEDLVQQTYLRILETKATFTGANGATPKTWACGILRRLWIDTWRARGVRRHDDHRPFVTASGESLAYDDCHGEWDFMPYDPTGPTTNLDTAIDVRTILKGATEDERALAEVIGGSVHEMARDLGWTRKRVEKTLAALRRKLERVA